MSYTKFMVSILIFAISLSACAPASPSPQPSQPLASPAVVQSQPAVEPTQTPFIQVTDVPAMDWPQQPVVIATGLQSVPVIAWLPNRELLFWYEQGVNNGVFWLSPQGRAVYVDFAAQGAPKSGTAMGYAAFLEPFSQTRYLVRLAAPDGAMRITHNVPIDIDLDEFPTRPPGMAKDVDSLREATHFAAAALQFFACTAARGASGEVRLTFDWACSSQAARLSRESDLSQWPVMLEPVASSLALVCPGSPVGAASIPFGQCIEEMAEWGKSLAASAIQAQRQAERFAEATVAVLALTPATEQAEYIPEITATPTPTSTLEASELPTAVSGSATVTPSPVPTGAGVCGWMQALPGVWDRDDDAGIGGFSEIEFYADSSYQAVLFDWPETLRGNVQCLADGTLKLTFRQGYLIAAVNLAEDRLSLDLLAAIGLPVSSQNGSWQYNRRLD